MLGTQGIIPTQHDKIMAESVQLFFFIFVDMNVEFTEKQRFSQWWIWVLYLFIIGTFVAAFVVQVIYKTDFGNNPMSDTGIVIGLAFSLIFVFFFRSIKLETRIDAEGIKVRFFPFRRTFLEIPWNLIAKAELRTYSPLSEFGGWGVRGIKSDRALTVSGRQGLQLVFVDGRKLLIGTRKAKLLAQILAQLKPINPDA